MARRVVAAFESSGAADLTANMEAVFSEQVQNVMSKPPIVLHGRQPVCRAARIMTERSVGVIPIVDGEGRLVDAVTELDFAFELLGSEAPAYKFATTHPIIADAGDTVIEALGEMLEYGFRRLPFLRNSEVYIATMHTLLLAIARSPTVVTLLGKISNYSQPAVVLDRAASVGEAAEAIAAVTERAVIFAQDSNPIDAIMTERDLVKAFYTLRCSKQ